MGKTSHVHGLEKLISLYLLYNCSVIFHKNKNFMEQQENSNNQSYLKEKEESWRHYTS